jgi:GTP 3',8-cyclase
LSALSRLAEVLQPNLLKLTGGEPLLHTEIVECIRAARSSNIAHQIQVTTNGFLLPKMADAFWEGIDRLTLNWYSSKPLDDEIITLAHEKCDDHQVVLLIKPATHFKQLTPTNQNQPEEVRKIYDRCWLKDRCHLLRDRVFYTCTRPPALQHWFDIPLTEHDGIALDEPQLRERLFAYLTQDEPLRSCHWCLGDSGSWIEHRQLPPSSVGP